MNRIILSLSIILCSLSTMAINVSFHYGKFMTPDKETYVETYLLFDASELGYKTLADSTYQAEIELTYIFNKKDEVASYSKTIVRGPQVADTNSKLVDFIDQQRFFVPVGKYNLTIVMRDLNRKSDTITSIQPIDLNIDVTKMFFSDVYLIDRIEKTKKPNVYERNGQDYFPKISPFYSPQLNHLQFYCELYNSNSMLPDESDFLVTIEIVDPGSDQVVGQYRTIQRKKAGSIDVISSKINIEDLATGSYVLLIQARDRENNVLAARSLPFKRFNESERDIELRSDPSKTFAAKLSEDSLRQMCYCMIYIGTEAEVDYIERNWKEAEPDELRMFFYSFWRDRNELDPRLEWARYQRLISHVEKSYGNNTRHGCGSDRGRIYLKYGEPNSMSISGVEASAYPYEIWHYYKIPGKSNAKFFFLDHNRNREFILGHSNVMGEPVDKLWYTRVVRETIGGVQSAAEPTQEAMGLEKDPYSHASRALDYWNNPR